MKEAGIVDAILSHLSKRDPEGEGASTGRACHQKVDDGAGDDDRAGGR